MSKIFISHSHQDKALHGALKDALIEIGHDVVGVDSLSVGANISKALNELLHAADAVVAIITEDSLSSKNVISEITVAQAQMDAIDSKIFMPVIVGNIEIPSFLRERLAVMVPDFSNENLTKVVSNIHRAVEHNLAIRTERKRAQKEQASKLEVSKTEFIKEAEERLTKKEASLGLSANIWYGIGYGALILGVLAALLLIKESLGGKVDTTGIILLSIKGLIGVGLLVASSKYAFSLGKSYMNESLKNSDRLHAISFGKFYLQVYGDVVTPDDVKEVFQHWNIDKDSSFRELGSDNFDPRIFESAIEIARVLTKNEKKSSKNT
ncbi:MULTISPECIES: toll/interleukin-1 receptor domain-containing protein [unclassified Pseudoalteromonas]|uniref:toll/interleukin-1 receptor domain-containing protein n=1 Tax=unclassified Pseudoalteromonas TaxID=194690 RepID=UPI0025B34E13|nr:MULTISPECIES: toll/interleukin-1 receptor domain-containing protein [unclassified Pseudoalteromonas]MDN3379726.1 toll/interleukin-1 receptor domain-containing protein [Pseudoalteromonas sp. APC 3893]MDN3388148.1 toll/interleukin-1 receptor domain-containing protein [Pseudoalteromonas sp. APC 4017]